MVIKDINLIGERVRLHRNHRGWHLFIGKWSGYFHYDGSRVYNYKTYKLPILKIKFKPFRFIDKRWAISVNGWQRHYKIFGISVYVYEIFNQKTTITLFKK